MQVQIKPGIRHPLAGEKMDFIRFTGYKRERLVVELQRETTVTEWFKGVPAKKVWEAGAKVTLESCDVEQAVCRFNN